MSDELADLSEEISTVRKVWHASEYATSEQRIRRIIAALAPQLRRGKEADEQWKLWQGSSNYFRHKATEAEQRIAELEAAIREHSCAPVRTAEDGQPYIAVAGDEENLKALLNGEGKG